MLPGERNASSHTCMRPRVQGNFMNLQCKYFQNPLCVAELFWWPCAFRSQIPKGKLQVPAFSRTCSRITETHKVLVYNQRNTHSGLEGMLKGVITHIEGVLLTHRCSTHRCLWFGKRKNNLRLPYSYTPLLLRHPSLVGIGDKKWCYGDSKYSHLHVLVLRWVKKQRCY